MNVLKLKNYRREAKMSQSDVAKLMDVTQSYYSLWEIGKRLPDAAQILQLCQIFKCSPNDLFGFKGVHAVVGESIRSNDDRRREIYQYQILYSVKHSVKEFFHFKEEINENFATAQNFIDRHKKEYKKDFLHAVVLFNLWFDNGRENLRSERLDEILEKIVKLKLKDLDIIEMLLNFSDQEEYDGITVEYFI